MESTIGGWVRSKLRGFEPRSDPCGVLGLRTDQYLSSAVSLRPRDLWRRPSSSFLVCEPTKPGFRCELTPEGSLALFKFVFRLHLVWLLLLLCRLLWLEDCLLLGRPWLPGFLFLFCLVFLFFFLLPVAAASAALVPAAVASSSSVSLFRFRSPSARVVPVPVVVSSAGISPAVACRRTVSF